MRIYLYLFFCLLLVSCLLDPEDENTRIEKISAFEIQVPDVMTVGFEHDISFKYALQNGCYSFYNVDVVDAANNNQPNKNIREITAFAEITNDTNCTLDYREESFVLPFKPLESRIYLFKFWTGQNEQGVDQFEEYELLVE